MSNHYVIVCDKMNLDEVVRQVRAIKTFPATVKIYDRVFPIESSDGVYGLLTGIEVGWFLCEERQEENKKL